MSNLSFIRNGTLGLVAAGMLLGGGAVMQAARVDGPRTFDTPQEAVQAAIDAAKHNDTAALIKLFGPEGRDIVETGDAAEDSLLRSEFARAADEKLHVETDPTTPDQATFTVGKLDWPFPVPVVRRNGKWQLDAATGRIEILARRIGANELNAIEICRGYAAAQLEYASTPHDGDNMLQYAQKIASTPTKQDGLYWEGAPTHLVPAAFAHADTTARLEKGTKLEPYHGYYFRVLHAQGPQAEQGAFSYMVNGRMVGGFALVAWPAEYGITAIRTFLINQEGVVYQKDMGRNTAQLARQLSAFNPDSSWKRVVLE